MLSRVLRLPSRGAGRVTTAVLLIALTGCGQGTTGPPGDRPPAEAALPPVIVQGTGTAPPLSEGGSHTAEALAEQEGRPVDEVARRLAGQSPHADVMAQLRQRHPTTFSHSDYLPGDGYDASVWFIGAAPPAALELIAGLPLDVRVRQDAVMLDDQRAAALDAAFGAVLAAGVQPWTGSVDPDTSGIGIGYEGPEVDDEAALEADALAAARAAVGGAAAESLSVELRPMPPEAQPQPAVAG